MDVTSKELLIAGLDDPATDLSTLCLSPYIAILFPLALFVIFVTVVITLRRYEKLTALNVLLM